MLIELYPCMMKFCERPEVARLHLQIRRERRPPGQSHGDIISQIE